MKRLHANIATVPNRRAGTMILQTLVTITLAAVLFGIVITCIHSLLRANSTLRQSAWDGIMQTRLASEFRRDCRLAAVSYTHLTLPTTPYV